MNKISCDIIKDLLPLYKDEVCSQKSRDMVEEHLPECEECRTYLEAMYQELPPVTSSWKDNTGENNSSDNIDIDIETAFLKKISRQINWWKTIFCSFILLIAVMTFAILKDALFLSVTSLQQTLGFDKRVSLEDIHIADLYQLKDGSLYFTLESDTLLQIPSCTVTSPDQLPETESYDNGETTLTLEKVSFLEKHILSRYCNNKFAFVIPLQEEYRNDEDDPGTTIHKSTGIYLEGKDNERLTIWQEGQKTTSAPDEIEKNVSVERQVLESEIGDQEIPSSTEDKAMIPQEYPLIIY